MTQIFPAAGRSKRGGRDSSTGGGFDGVGSGVFSSDDEEGAGKTSGRGASGARGGLLFIVDRVSS